jgi:hypothetical protein
MTSSFPDRSGKGAGAIKPLAALALAALILGPPTGAVLAPTAALADAYCDGLEDKMSATADLADQLGYACEEGDDRKCGRLAERVLCEYNAYTAQAGNCRSRRMVKDMTFILDSVGDYGDHLEDLERQGKFTNIAKTSGSERRRVCQAAGAFGA